jgi:hypothetical protein
VGGENWKIGQRGRGDSPCDSDVCQTLEGEHHRFRRGGMLFRYKGWAGEGEFKSGKKAVASGQTELQSRENRKQDHNSQSTFSHIRGLYKDKIVIK